MAVWWLRCELRLQGAVACVTCGSCAVRGLSTLCCWPKLREARSRRFCLHHASTPPWVRCLSPSSRMGVSARWQLRCLCASAVPERSQCAKLPLVAKSPSSSPLTSFVLFSPVQITRSRRAAVFPDGANRGGFELRVPLLWRLDQLL